MSPSDQEKIKSLGGLARVLAQHRADGRKVVHCHGVFDLLHIGHIRYLQRARRLGDVLVVTVTADRFVNKGAHRPAFPQQYRLDAVAALACVDYAALSDSPTATESIRQLQPHVFAKGAEFRDRKTPELLQEEDAARSVGADVEYVEDVTSSSSELINTHLALFPPQTEQYLAELRHQFSAEQILGSLAKARPLRTLVVGEAIIDEYYFCAAAGLSTKAPSVVAKYQSHERFAGGALAVANQLAAFCDQVDVLTMLGQQNSEEEWIRRQLKQNVTPTFFRRSDAPTIVKRRYHESYFDGALFSIDFLNDDPLTDGEAGQVRDLLCQTIESYDLVVVADYGHSFLSESAVSAVCDGARCLAVNTQSNAGNIGIHTISKYPRADYALLSRKDLELECRNRSGDLEQMLHDVGVRLKTRTITVTLGKDGCLCYQPGAGLHRASGLSTHVVDRSGAAEAFFATSALCAAVDASPEVLAFCGNVAGAEAVSVVGTSQLAERSTFERHVESLLK